MRVSLLSSLRSRARAFPFASSRGLPEVPFQVHAKFNDGDTFGFEKFFLEQRVWATNQDFSAVADHAVPGNALSRRSGGHGASRGARATGQPEGSSQPSIG